MKRVFAVFAVLALASTIRAQSLGDIAAKTQEDRDKAKSTTPTKAYSDKDLIATPAPALATAEPTTTPGTNTTSSKEDATKTPKNTTDESTSAKKGEAYWKDRMRVLKARLDSDTASVNDITKRLAEYSQSVSQSEKAVNGTIYVNRTSQDKMLETKDELARAKVKVDNDKHDIDNLEEEARRAGAPPGWLRF